MLRAVRHVTKSISNLSSRKISTTQPTPPNGPSKGNNDLFLLGGGAAIVGILYVAYKMEDDPDFEKSMSDVPGIGLLEPVRGGIKSAGLVEGKGK